MQPQVAPGAMISLRSLLRFTFNPYGVVHFNFFDFYASSMQPQVAPGAMISLRSLLRFTFNPYGVVHFNFF